MGPLPSTATSRVRVARALMRLACVLLAYVGLPAAASAQVPSVADLPLTEVSAKGNGHLFVVFLTGDGGWVTLDQGVAAELAEAGMPVVGFNQRIYLWSAKSPAQTGADLARVITAYRARWQRDSVLVIGYSRGAGVAPFAVNRLPTELRRRVVGLVLIGSEHTASFHFRMRDLISSTPSPDDRPMMPEIRLLGALPLLCFYGDEEKDTICPDLSPPAMSVRMKGGHHLDGAYGEIGRRVIAAFK